MDAPVPPAPKPKKRTKYVTAVNLNTGSTIVTWGITQACKETNLSAVTVYRSLKDPSWRSRRGWYFRRSTSAEVELLLGPEAAEPPKKRRKRKNKSKDGSKNKRNKGNKGNARTLGVTPKDPIVRMFLEKEGIDPDTVSDALYISNPDPANYTFGTDSRFLAVDATTEDKFFFDSRKEMTTFLERLDPMHKPKATAMTDAEYERLRKYDPMKDNKRRYFILSNAGAGVKMVCTSVAEIFKKSRSITREEYAMCTADPEHETSLGWTIKEVQRNEELGDIMTDLIRHKHTSDGPIAPPDDWHKNNWHAYKDPVKKQKTSSSSSSTTAQKKEEKVETWFRVPLWAKSPTGELTSHDGVAQAAAALGLSEDFIKKGLMPDGFDPTVKMRGWWLSYEPGNELYKGQCVPTMYKAPGPTTRFVLASNRGEPTLHFDDLDQAARYLTLITGESNERIPEHKGELKQDLEENGGKTVYDRGYVLHPYVHPKKPTGPSEGGTGKS